MSHSEDLLTAWVETVEDYAIILLDVEGNIASWNKGAERLLKHKEEEVLGRPSKIIYTDEDVDKGIPEQELNTALAMGSSKDERWHVRKDGTQFWGFGSLSILKTEQGVPRGFVKAFRDLTERKRLEERAAAAGGRTPRRGSASQRLPGHALARAAQPAVADPQFGLHPRQPVRARTTR